MKGRMFVAGALVAAVATPMQAQSGISAACPAGAGALTVERVTQDACQMAVDLFSYMAPQLGTALAGGNATLGQGGTLGGLGHFSVGVRANAVFGSLPQLDTVTVRTGGAERKTFATENQFVPLPTVDAAIGIFKGLPLGLTNVGGVDLLVNAAYVPGVSGDNVDLTVPNGSLKLGYGARVGLLQETIAIPGVSVTYLKRDLPTLSVEGSSDAGRFNVENLELETTAWRLTASKSFFVLGLAAGVGQDTYESSADVQGFVATGVGEVGSPRVALSQKLTRTNYFADVSLNLLLLKLVGEIGSVSGGEVETFSQFADKEADASRLYGSVGLRLTF